MKVILSSLVVCFIFFSSFTGKDPKQSVKAELKSAVVYRVGATLTHKATASLESGNTELVIEGLSSYIDINSIQVNCPAAVTILGTEYSNNYLTPENINPAVKVLQDSLDKITAAVQKIDNLINTANEMSGILQQNRDVKGQQTGLSVAELAKLMIYYEQKSNELKEKLSGYYETRRKLSVSSARISNQITEERNKNTVTGGRITLQLNSSTDGPAEFTVTYNTQNAGWVPYYDIRADNIKSPLKLIYKAKIAQTTGIDWKKIKLSLSTSLPKQYGNAPVPQTWFLSFINPVTAMNREMDRSMDVKQALAGKVSAVPVQGELSTVTVGALGIRSSARSVGTSRSAVSNAQLQLGDYITVTENNLDITYEIELPYDIPATGKQQIAVLKETTIPASYKYYAAPRLDKSAYLLADITDWQTMNLLAGEANIIFEGTYIGKTVIDPAVTLDTLHLTLGIDKRVNITREKLKDFSSVKFLGSNRVQTITYEITVKNNKKDAIVMTVKDQYPKSTDKDIEVNLTESSNGSVNEETGIITWQLNLAPGDSKKLRFTYSVKFPKDKLINPN